MNNSKIAFYIGNLPIHWYSLFFLFAAVIVFFITLYELKKLKLPSSHFEIFFIWMIIIGFIGARIWFLVGNHKNIHNFIDIIAVWKGGIAIEGGVFSSTIFGVFYFYRISKIYKINCWLYFDIILTNLFLAQSIGRWGNFFNQEILGGIIPHNSFILSILPNFIVDNLHYLSDNAYNGNVYRVPLFLYESFITYSLWIFCTWQIFYNKKIRSGSVGFLWFALYGILRTIMEPFRADVDILRIGGIESSVLLSVVYFSFGGIFFLLNQKIIYTKIWEIKIRKLYEKH